MRNRKHKKPVKRNPEMFQEERIREALVENLTAEKPKSVRQLAEELNASKSTVDRIKKKYNLIACLDAEPKIPKNLPNKPRKIKESHSVVEKYVSDRTKFNAKKYSDKIVDLHINTIESIHYAVEEVRTINEKLKDMVDSVPEQLQELMNYLDSGISNEIFSSDEEILKAKTMIYNAIASVSAIVPNNAVRIKAINELGNWIDRFEKYESSKVAIRTMELQLEALFKGLTILDEDNYQKIKGFILDTAPESIRLFDKFEAIQQAEYEEVSGEQQV